MRFAAGQEDGEKTAPSICACMDLRVAPASRAANRLILLPSFPPAAERCALMCVESNHLGVCRSLVSGKFLEQIFPDPTPRPAHETVIDGCRRAVLRRAITPPAAAFQHMHNAADDTAIVHPCLATDIRWKMRFDPAPLPVRQPKRLATHDAQPFQYERITIALSGQNN